MRRISKNLMALCALAMLSACDAASPGRDDIHLPEGDAARGEAYFTSLGCVNCHSVVGSEPSAAAGDGSINVLLGSRYGRRMSYGQLVTAVVNPSHKLSGRYRAEDVSEEGESLMTTYNDSMTVSQLTDLVAFLQAHYDTARRPGYRYPDYSRPSGEQSDDES